MPKTASVLGTLLIAYALAATPFWIDSMWIIQSSGASYSDARTTWAFGGRPLDQLGAALSTRLGPEKPIALAPPLAGVAFVNQRVTEALYPRKIVPQAKDVLDGDEQGRFTLNGKRVELESEAAQDHLELSPLLFIGLVLSVLGFGLAVWRLVAWATRAETGQVTVPALLLAGSAAIGLLVTAASWFQIELNWNVLAALGVILFVARIRGLPKPAIPKGLETLGFAFLLLLLFVRIALWPVVLWDGRSIWLFHAKQIFSHGMLARADLLDPELRWSHEHYPLLYPGWLAFFSAGFGQFNERMASLGIVVLNGALFALLWRLGRRALGRLGTGVVTVVLFLLSWNLTTGAYADGLVTCLLLIEFLGFGSEHREDRLVAWIATLVASLTKYEGLVLSAMMIAGFRARDRRFGLWPALALVPALLHKAWITSLGLESFVKGKPARDVAAEFFPRLGELLGYFPELLFTRGYTGAGTMLWCGLAGLAAVAWLALSVRAFPRSAGTALLVGAALTAFAFGSISALPQDVHWFVQTALDRLLLHPSALLMLTPFLWLSKKGYSGAGKT